MKFITLLILSSMLSFAAHAFEVKVSKMKNHKDMERAFELKTNVDDLVVLDCQSFIQGLSFGEGSGQTFIMLDAQECQDLYTRIRGSLRKFEKHCLDVEDTIRSDYTCR